MANNLKLIAEGGLIILIVISLAILLERLTNSNVLQLHVLDPGFEVIDDGSSLLPIDDDVKAFQQCLLKHSESPYFPLDEYNETSSCGYKPEECMRYTIINLSVLMKSFGIKLLYIEPTVLFCLQPRTRKFSILTRGFNNDNLRGSRNVMTFAIFPSEAKILDLAPTRLKIAQAEFRIRRFPNWIIGNDSTNLQKLESGVSTVHYFIIHRDLVMHLVPFYRRGSYNWSPGFNSSAGSPRGLLFVNSCALEDFSVLPYRLSVVSNAAIYIPSNVKNFLLDAMSSSFIECETKTENPAALMALKEVKSALSSRMVIFLLWSKSLQGWYEKCDVFSYSDEMNLAIAAKSVEGYNFSALFAKSECQQIERRSNLNTIVRVELRCHKLVLNVIFMYEEEEAYWYEHLDGQKTYKLSFPKFTLCSTDVYDLKINVPCETSEILNSEYGQFLKNATLQMDPSGAMRNVALENRKAVRQI